jgi:predicted acylesterase/phospholipase RssA
MVDPSPSTESGGSPTPFQRDPEKECDIVMKGGITSGVVYPPAVLELQRTYSFRNIGGTSAGAIAAAVTAAAEYDRENGGFQRLGKVRDQLSERGFLLELFTPQPATRPLMKTLLRLFMPEAGKPLPLGGTWPAGLGGRVKSVLARLRRLAAILREELPEESRRGRTLGVAGGLLAVVCILLPGAVVTGLSWNHPRGWALLAGAGLVPLLLGVVLGGFLGLLIAPLARLAQIVSSLPGQSSFGLCSGLAEESQLPALTTWLADTIDLLAGRPGSAVPLTFADLESKRRKPADDAGWTPPDAAISLRMVTSDLSLGRPLVFPRVDDFAGNDLLFRVQDMQRLFPARIVDHLVCAAYRSENPKHPDRFLPEGFHYLPPGNELPVVVAARFSLSFPFLLAAVPLYSIRLSGFSARDAANKAGTQFRYDPDTHFAKHWLSDGGICSNFPIHFFDAWAPGRPTFGVNLADVQEGDKLPDGKIKPDAIPMSPETHAAPASAFSDPTGEVFLPLPNQTSAVQLPWRPIEGLIQFAMAIFDTSQGYHDALQAMLPSYRERIVQIRLQPSEGGLNLTMDSGTIRRMQDKGTRAGEALSEMDFPQHRWTRFLVLMAQLERGLYQLGKIYPGAAEVKAMLDEQALNRWYLHKPLPWMADAEARMAALLTLVDAWQKSTPAKLFSADPPHPPAVLRVTPPV